jgi:serine/threonine protein kinase
MIADDEGRRVSPEGWKGNERFEIRRQLGAGGMGFVYAAWDRERACEVALKTLRRIEPAALYRFKREFRALADLNHRNLVRLHELVQEDEFAFFTMELVDGVDFLRWVGLETWPGADTDSVPGPPLDAATALPPLPSAALDALGGGAEPPPASAPPPEPPPAPSATGDDTVPRALPLPARLGFRRRSCAADPLRLRSALRQLASGLMALHSHGCLHRDVKPSNVLVGRDGRVVLLDLGLVTWLTPAEASLERYVAGTGAYMSPEQAAARALDEASDWYSVGVVLYEALSGVRPFRGTFDEVVAAKQLAEPPPPSDVVDGVPEDLDRLCAALLQTDPRLRPGGARILEMLGPEPPSPPADGSPSGDGMAAGAAPGGAAFAAAARSSPRSAHGSSFVGRAAPLQTLRAAYARAQEGRAVTVHLHAPSGMGKSSLLRSFLEELATGRDGAVLLSGRCYERETVPYKAIDGLVDSLSRWLRSQPRGRAESVLPRDVAALARAFPVLRQVEAVALAPARPGEVPDPREARRRAFRALRELLARMAERWPLVLCIDDLQWGDVDSASLLADLLRPPEAPALLLIAAYRAEEAQSSPHLKELRAAQGLDSGEPSPGAGPLRAADPDVVELSLLPLDESEASELALQLLGESFPDAERRARAVALEARGIPFFVHELVRHVEESRGRAPSEGGTPISASRLRLEDVVSGRLQGLPPAARLLLETVAVAGRPLPRGVASRAADLGAGEHPALDLLRAEHLLRVRDTADGEALEPYHDRIREVLLEELQPWVLRERHLRLALALEGTRDADPEALAELFSGAGHLERAGEHAVQAAQERARALAFDRSAMLYRFAMRLLPKEDVERRRLRPALAAALAQAGRSVDAARVYLECVSSASGAEALELRRHAAEEFLRAGHLDEGVAVLQEVLSAVGMRLPRSPAGALLSLLLRRAQLRLRGLRWKECDPSRLDPGAQTRIDVCWSAAAGLAMIDPIRGADFQTRGLLLSLDAGEPYRVARSLAMEAGYQSLGGPAGRERARPLLAEASALAERIGSGHVRGLGVATSAVAAYEGGQWRRARELGERAESLFLDSCSGVTLEVATNRHFLVLALLQLGELQELSRRVPLYIQDAEDRGDRFTATSFRNGCMNIAWLVCDDALTARQQVARAMQPWRQRAFLLQHYEGWFAELSVELYAGEGPRAWRRVARDWPALRRSKLLSIQQLRIEALYLRGRSALAAALGRRPSQSPLPAGDDAPAETPLPSRASLLSEARGIARRMERERMAWSDPLAAALRAAADAADGRKEPATHRLQAAALALETQDMPVYAAAARRLRGLLLGGSAGVAETESADATLRTRGVRDPVAMAGLFLPGAAGEIVS